MAEKSKKDQVVDTYIGMDDKVKIYSLLKAGLVAAGFTDEKADRYAYFCQAAYKELKDKKDVLDSMQRIATANKLLPGAIALDLTKSVTVLKDSRLAGGVGIVAPVIDRLAAIAKYYNVELNECSLSVAKVAMDIAGAGVGAVTSVEGFGIPLLVLSVLATYNDGNSLSKACFL